MTEIKQFNFKISATLLEQLRRTAVAKDTTVTELIIQGIHQVLGIVPSPKTDDIEMGIYQKLDALEQKLLEFEGYQSTVDIKLAGQIESIRKKITAIESFQTDTVADIARSIYIELEREKTAQVYTDIDVSIDTELDQIGTQEPALEITNVVASTTKDAETPAKKAQLTLPLDQNNEEIPGKVRTINTSKLIKILQQADPSRGWNSDKLRNLRQSKKSKDNQHTAGNCKFKYVGEDSKASRDNKYLWLLIP
jgi:hypothetical protein